METVFVTSSQDEFGVKAIELLKQSGAKTEVLPAGAFTPWGSIAIFKALRERPTGASHYMKTASLKLEDDLTPVWAQTTLFRVEIYETRDRRPNPRSRTDTPSTFRRALENLWQMYQNWNPGNSEDPVPWTRAAKDPSIVGHDYQKLVLQWHTRVTSHKAWFSLVKPSHEKTSTEKLTDGRISAGDWYVNICHRTLAFPSWAQRAGQEYLRSWQRHFANEKTWARQEVGVPSLIVRLDGTLADGTFRIYEVEERPAGIGVTSKINSQFTEALTAVRREWPNFTVVISRARTGSDDHLWISTANHNGNKSQLVLVRAEPEEYEYHQYVGRSVSSVVNKGNKSYGVPLSWWRLIQFAEPNLPWHKPFVIKPIQSSKCRDVEVWLPNQSPQARRFRNGSSTQERILQTLEHRREMYLQDFYEPMEVEGAGDMHMILRVFYGYLPSRREWICLGGCWNARSNVVVHGASDAVFGPLVLE